VVWSASPAGGATAARRTRHLAVRARKLPRPAGHRKFRGALPRVRGWMLPAVAARAPVNAFPRVRDWIEL